MVEDHEPFNWLQGSLSGSRRERLLTTDLCPSTPSTRLPSIITQGALRPIEELRVALSRIERRLASGHSTTAVDNTAVVEWWVRMDSNHRPPRYKLGALTN